MFETSYDSCTRRVSDLTRRNPFAIRCLVMMPMRIGSAICKTTDNQCGRTDEANTLPGGSENAVVVSVPAGHPRRACIGEVTSRRCGVID